MSPGRQAASRALGRAGLFAMPLVAMLACAPQQPSPLKVIPTPTAPAATPNPFPSGMLGVGDPRGLAVDADGNAYLVNGAAGQDPAGRVLKYGSSQTLLGTFELGAEGGPAACDASGSLWTISSSPSLRLFRLSANGAVTSYPLATGSTGAEARGLAIDPQGGVWISEASRGVIVRCVEGVPVREVSLPADAQGRAARPWALAVSTTSLWVASHGSSQVFAYGFASQSFASFSLPVEGTGSIALDRNGFVYAGTAFKPGTTRAIVKLQPTGQLLRDYDLSQAVPTALAGDSRYYLWGLDRLYSRVIRLTPATGEMLLYASHDVVRPVLLATDPQGRAWVASPATPGSTGSLYVVPAAP